ncbi:MAG: alkene reductase [Polyangiaceae bacterium]|nr:alkene reductase [Polyangiaceae bacterium]
MTTDVPALFEPLRAGELMLPNRIVMAPLTRCRATGDRVPNALMRDYYVQRASAGLILTEATSVMPQGVGYPDTPGIWSEEQVEGWRAITSAVHAAGGRILLQLWHVGRISHPTYLGGELPVSSSAVAPKGHVSLIRPKTAYVTPRALRRDEIPGVVAAFRLGAENAQRAGFDGVEIHGANGYLLDQFLQDSVNRRDDDYGGALENRARLHLEITDACVSVWGAGRVGMHLAPLGDVADVGDSDLVGTFSYLARELGKRRLAFLCARAKEGPEWIVARLKREFDGVVIANEGFTRETAEAAIARGDASAVAFGRLIIANPDLVERFRTHAPLNEARPDSFYTHEAAGYTDYPSL